MPVSMYLCILKCLYLLYVEIHSVNYMIFNVHMHITLCPYHDVRYIILHTSRLLLLRKILSSSQSQTNISISTCLSIACHSHYTKKVAVNAWFGESELNIFLILYMP